MMIDNIVGDIEHLLTLLSRKVKGLKLNINNRHIQFGQ